MHVVIPWWRYNCKAIRRSCQAITRSCQAITRSWQLGNYKIITCRQLQHHVWQDVWSQAVASWVSSLHAGQDKAVWTSSQDWDHLSMYKGKTMWIHTMCHAWLRIIADNVCTLFVELLGDTLLTSKWTIWLQAGILLRQFENKQALCKPLRVTFGNKYPHCMHALSF